MKILLKFSLLLFLIIGHVYAETSSPKAKLLLINKDIKPGKLEKHFIIERPVYKTSTLPTVNERDKVFAGISTVEKWEDLEKDLLYVNLKTLPIKQLQSRYPQLKKMEVETMKNRMKK